MCLNDGAAKFVDNKFQLIEIAVGLNPWPSALFRARDGRVRRILLPSLANYDGSGGDPGTYCVLEASRPIWDRGRRNPLSAGTVCRRQILTCKDSLRAGGIKNIYNGHRHITYVFQLSVKIWLKTFMMISNGKNTLVSMVFTKIMQRPPPPPQWQGLAHPPWITIHCFIPVISR